MIEAATSFIRPDTSSKCWSVLLLKSKSGPMGNGSFTPCTMPSKKGKYQQLATSQAQIDGVLIRLPNQANHLRRLTKSADKMIAVQGGKTPEHWKGLNGLLKAVASAKGSNDPNNATIQGIESIS